MLEIMVMSSYVGVGLFVVLLSEAASVSGNIMVYNDNTSQLVAEYRDMPARFGSIVSPEGIQAMLVYADPPDACSPIARPPQSAIIGGAMQWAVLIKRFNCSFYDKVKHAQDANYSIAIVHNVGSDELEPMAEDKHVEPIYIVAVFIGERAGIHLRDRYLYNQSYFIELNNDYPFIIDNLLWPFALVVGLCFFLMLGFMVGVVVKCIKDRRRAQRRRLPYSSLKQIPTSKFHKGDPYETCAICLEDFVEGEKLRVLPCSHAYHSKCIDPWLTRKRRVCPVCKRKVFAADEVPQPASLSDSDADSDMDADDHTHLIRPRGMQTDGGTFSTNQQNPLLRGGAGREQQQRRQWSSSSESSSASSSDGVQPLGELVARLIAEYEVEARNSRQAGEEGGEGGRRANEEEGGGREVSLPINASIDDHQELPAVVAGTSGSYQESSNSSAISSLWKSWKR